MACETFLLGDFELDPVSGELTRLGTDGHRATPHRLAPQPAQLLAMLIEKQGQVLTREEIQRRVWPDVEVDFEQGLNFCVRQVRLALGDSASKPRYVETLPRRGYRLLMPAQPLAAEEPEGPEATALGRPKKLPPRHLVQGLAAGIVISILVAALWTMALRWTSDPPRIGIRPFTAPAGFSDGLETEAISERILVGLTQQAGPRAEVLGPRSTSGYESERTSLRRMSADLDLDYFLNAKFLRDEGGKRLLVELIRTTDSAHIWVASFSDLSSTHSIADAAIAGTVEKLDLAVSGNESK